MGCELIGTSNNQTAAASRAKLNTAGRFYVYRIACVAALGGFLFGFDTAIINGAIVFLRQQFRWNNFQTEIAASSLLIGCVLGASTAGWVSDRYGRRFALLLSATIFAISSLATAITANLPQFFVARLLGGIAIGIASMLVPMYTAEVSPEVIRGQLVTLNQLAIMLGIVLSYITAWRVSSFGPDSWRWMFAVMTIPSSLFFLALFTVPESPRWLVKMRRTSQAVRILERSGEPASRVGEIEAALIQERGVRVTDRRLRKPLIIGVVLAIMQQVTGINTILYYGSIIFTEQVGTGKVSAALWANVIIGLVNLFFSVIALFLIDRLGRRALLIFSSGGMGVSLLVLSFLFTVHGVAGRLILALILCYVGCFSVGLGPGVWVVIAELFPTRVRGRAMSIATISLWSACLLITSSFLSLVHAISISGAFAMYAVLSFITLAFVWSVLPETKGRTLEAIEHQWLA